MQQQKDDEREGAKTQDAELYDRYGAAIFAYVRSQHLSREDAEDVTVTVFLAALERDNLAELSSKEQLSWLRRVAHNKLVDHYRQASRHPAVALEQAEDMMDSDSTQDPEYAALQQEEYHQLHQAIGKLPAMQQQILHLRFGLGLPLLEIAALLNKRDTAIRKQLSRTLTFLRTIYDDHDNRSHR